MENKIFKNAEELLDFLETLKLNLIEIKDINKTPDLEIESFNDFSKLFKGRSIRLSSIFYKIDMYKDYTAIYDESDNELLEKHKQNYLFDETIEPNNIFIVEPENKIKGINFFLNYEGLFVSYYYESEEYKAFKQKNDILVTIREKLKDRKRYLEANKRERAKRKDK